MHILSTTHKRGEGGAQRRRCAEKALKGDQRNAFEFAIELKALQKAIGDVSFVFDVLE